MIAYEELCDAVARWKARQQGELEADALPMEGEVPHMEAGVPPMDAEMPSMEGEAPPMDAGAPMEGEMSMQDPAYGEAPPPAADGVTPTAISQEVTNELDIDSVDVLEEE